MFEKKCFWLLHGRQRTPLNKQTAVQSKKVQKIQKRSGTSEKRTPFPLIVVVVVLPHPRKTIRGGALTSQSKMFLIDFQALSILYLTGKRRENDQTHNDSFLGLLKASDSTFLVFFCKFLSFLVDKNFRASPES